MNKLKGLTTQEVNQRIKEGKINTLPKPEIKTNRQIIVGQVFTLFNLYNLIIAIALISVQAWTSLFFVLVMFTNMFMFTFQEIRSRNLISKLKIIVTPKTKVLRDGHIKEIDNESIVLDDIVVYQAGDQISADAQILSGNVEVNESLLTGEVEPVDKTYQDSVLSGSFIVSGSCYARIINVGKDNYAIKITSAVKTNRVISSQLLNTFQYVTKVTSYFILPIGFLLLYQGLSVRDNSFKDVIMNSSTALMGMLPKGLVLLTTLSLVGAVIKLGSKKTLVQDLYAIETLSQASVLCLDKTGTLTLGNMTVIDTEVLDESYKDYIAAYAHDTEDNNATAHAIVDHTKDYPKSDLIMSDAIAFSSARKWAAINFTNNHAVIIGAPEVLAPGLNLPTRIEILRHKGARIVMVCESLSPVHKDSVFKGLIPLAFIAIEDPIRDDAYDAIQFFRENDVTAKVISGDNVETVAAIAKKAGIENHEIVIDASKLTSRLELQDAILNSNVIGRATPTQKLEFVKILQESKEVVAMTGDGINDVLALKSADCSIAMGEGSDAALHISQIVVMDGLLSTLVDVVKEGRMVINNITRSASMYYLHTILCIVLSIIAIGMNVPFPFIPFQITITNMFIDGWPSFMLLWQPNYERPKETILRHVLRHSFPNAFSIIAMWLILNLFQNQLNLTGPETRTMMFYLNGMISIHMIYRIYKPLNWYRAAVLVIDIIAFPIATWIFWGWLGLSTLSPHALKLTLLLMLLSIPLTLSVYGIIIKLFGKQDLK